MHSATNLRACLQGNKDSPPFYDTRVAINRRLIDDHCYRATLCEYQTYQKLHDSVPPHSQAPPKQVHAFGISAPT